MISMMLIGLPSSCSGGDDCHCRLLEITHDPESRFYPWTATITAVTPADNANWERSCIKTWTRLEDKNGRLIEDGAVPLHQLSHVYSTKHDSL